MALTESIIPIEVDKILWLIDMRKMKGLMETRKSYTF